MSRYDNCSREELIRRIEELEAQLDTPKASGSRFRERYACKILDSIPDMLTVLDREGTLVELVSADETNHVGVPGGELAGQNIRTRLSPSACTPTVYSVPGSRENRENTLVLQASYIVLPFRATVKGCAGR